MDADGGNCSLLTWLCCSAHVSNETQGSFLTKFILVPKVNLCTARSPTTRFQKNDCKHVCLCSICTHNLFCAARALTWRYRCATNNCFGGKWWHQKIYVGSYLRTKTKGSTRKWNHFWVMSPLGTQLSRPGRKSTAIIRWLRVCPTMSYASARNTLSLLRQLIRNYARSTKREL